MTATTADPPARCDDCHVPLTVANSRWLIWVIGNVMYPVCVDCCRKIEETASYTGDPTRSRWMFRKRVRDRYEGGAS